MKKLLLFAVLALPAFPQFFGGSNASKIRGINVLGPLTVSDGCALVYVAASTRFECGAGSGGGTGNGIVAVTVSAATSATLTHNAALATPYIAPFVCREDTTNLPVIPATTTFTTNAIAFTFSPAFTGKCAASTGGSGISGSIATSQICYGSASNTCAGSAGLTFSDSANVRLATLAGGSSQSTNPLLDITNSAGTGHHLTVLGDGKVGIGTNAPGYQLDMSSASNLTFRSISSTFNDFTLQGSGVRQVYNRTNAGANNGMTFQSAGTAKWSMDIVDTSRDANEGLAFSKAGLGAALTNSVMYLTRTGSVGIGLANATPTGTLHVYDATASTGATTLTVKAGAGQTTTTLQEWQNSSGTALGSISSAGYLTLPAGSSSLPSFIIGSKAPMWSDGSGLYLGNGTAVGAANSPIFYFDVNVQKLGIAGFIGLGASTPASTDTSLSRIHPGGIVGVGTGAAGSTAGTLQAATLQALGAGTASNPMLLGSGTWFTGGSATTTKPYLLIEPSGTTSTGWSTSGTGIGVNAASGFTGNLMDLQVAGVSKLKLSGAGVLTVADALSIGAGLFFGGSGFIEPIATGVWSFKNALGTDFGRINLGPATSSFPALKRSTTGLIARLADDSADTWVQASQFRSTLTTPASAAATCTAGTIVADTGFVYVCTATDTWKRVAIATW